MGRTHYPLRLLPCKDQRHARQIWSGYLPERPSERETERLRFTLRKHIENNFIAVAIGLPNLAITAGTITALSLWHPWLGIFGLVPYLIGQVFSVQYSALFGQATEMTFKIGRHEYHYSKK